MGIELPAELADVAAAAGVQWPRADEDAMRTSATAWRQAGAATSALAADADGTANQALSAVRGTAGTAAQQHWHTFVAPDTGHLTSTAKGCTDAADRLDHAADQVGAAKVRIVQHLVDLAKNTDAANHAAAAGHPAALAGLTTAVQGTALNVAQVNHGLTSSIRLDNGTPPLLSGPTNVITHTVAAPLAGAQGLAVASAAGPLAHTVDQVAGPVAHTVDQVTGPVAHTVDQVAGPVADPLPTAHPAGPPLTGLAGGHGVGQVIDPVAGPGGTGLLGQPAAQVPQPGPVPLPHDPAGGPVLGHTPIDHGVQPAMGATVAQSAAPVMASPPVAPAAAPTELPATGSPHPTFAPATAATPDLGVPAPSAPQSPAAGPPLVAGPPPTSGPTRGPAPSSAPTGSVRDDLINPVATPPPAAANPVQRRSAAVPSRPPADAALPNVSVSRPAKRDEVALFLVHLFPIGQLPTATSRPTRQLPPPPPDTDFAAGLRFPPHDHPDSHLIDDSHPAASSGPHPGRTADELAAGYDPLGGEHERDWDRRFLVRPATDETTAEYAWPPCELFPEGGFADGEPIVLAEGTVIDRFGTQEGRVFSADGTPFARRCLPPDHLAAGYHRYRVTADLPVWRTLSAPWFGQPGGGERYRAVYPAADLMALGYLMEMTDDGR